MESDSNLSHRRFAARMLMSARDRKWKDVIRHAEEAETVHGPGTSLTLLAALALAADGQAPAHQRTPTGAPDLSRLGKRSEVYAFTEAAWSRSPRLSAVQKATPTRVHHYVNITLPTAQEFTEAVHHNDAPGAGNLYHHHIQSGIPAQPEGVFNVYDQGHTGLRVALMNFAYTGWIMTAANAAISLHQGGQP